MIPKAAVVDSEVPRRFPPLQPVSPDQAVPEHRPRRIVFWDEIGETIPALLNHPHLEPGGLTAISRPEKLAATYGLRACQPSPQLQLP